MTAEFPLAVHALVYLTHRHGIASSRELAENICTNPARVRKVMAKLHTAGLVCAGRGKGSGYRAGDGAKGITLADVLTALGEEPIDLRWRSGDIDRDCLIASGMGAVMDGIYEDLNAGCLRRLAAVTIDDVRDMLFPEGASAARSEADGLAPGERETVFEG